MTNSEFINIEIAQPTQTIALEKSPFSPIKLLGIAILLWGLTIMAYQLVIAGLSSVQQTILDYISLL